jgi:hypothetical protein
MVYDDSMADGAVVEEGRGGNGRVNVNGMAVKFVIDESAEEKRKSVVVGEWAVAGFPSGAGVELGEVCGAKACAPGDALARPGGAAGALVGGLAGDSVGGSVGGSEDDSGNGFVDAFVNGSAHAQIGDFADAPVDAAEDALVNGFADVLVSGCGGGSAYGFGGGIVGVAHEQVNVDCILGAEGGPEHVGDVESVANVADADAVNAKGVVDAVDVVSAVHVVYAAHVVDVAHVVYVVVYEAHVGYVADVADVALVYVPKVIQDAALTNAEENRVAVTHCEAIHDVSCLCGVAMITVDVHVPVEACVACSELGASHASRETDSGVPHEISSGVVGEHAVAEEHVL